MKTKTIEKVISGKINKFIESIDDPAIQKIIKEQTIVTGGCITSMLLGEDINDFDLYIRTKKGAFKVAEYFLEKKNIAGAFVCGAGFSSYEDFAKKEGFEDKEKESYLKSIFNDPDRIRVYIPSSGVAIDENTPEQESIDIALNKAEPEPEVKNTFNVSFISSNAITLTDKIQIIIRFSGEPEEILENYDFEHCKNYWCSWTGELTTFTKSLECILAKDLFYSGSKYPLCSIFRTKKFINRGWKINAGQYLKMALQLNEMDLTDPVVLEDQLVGVDSAYFMQVIEKMADSETEKIDAVYLTKIIDRIF